ncbi:LacI family DNA-binding transcriptional regulator [Hoeflea sp. TYP-13]|uniref:LacI family DNA-binding transcriptional regulator n=1 Tax=Hoeflea sp. TYP-13 TaxID=3230023 RepID=UPI0034C5FF49
MSKSSKQRATLNDVARLAGVDVSTASRVLRGDTAQRVGKETKDRIHKSAKELEYLPNSVARALRTSKTYTLGIVVPQLDNPVFSAVIRGAERAAVAKGYSLLISHREPGETATTIANLSKRSRVDGLLVASLDEDEVLRTDLEAANVPYVLLNRQLPGAYYAVVLKSREAAKRATDYLISLGHRRIAHLSGRLGGFNANERLKGYCDALREAGIDYDSSLVEEAGYTFEGGKSAMLDLLGGDATAVMAATMVSAAGAMVALHEAGRQIPEDMSIIALHDGAIAEMLYPALSTVGMPTEEMGSVAAAILIQLLAGEQPEAVAALPAGPLIVRASTGPMTI